MAEVMLGIILCLAAVYGLQCWLRSLEQTPAQLREQIVREWRARQGGQP